MIFQKHLKKKRLRVKALNKFYNVRFFLPWFSQCSCFLWFTQTKRNPWRVIQTNWCLQFFSYFAQNRSFTQRQFDVFTLWVTRLNEKNSFKLSPCPTGTHTYTDAQNSSICYLRGCQKLLLPIPLVDWLAKFQQPARHSTGLCVWLSGLTI